MKTVFNGKIYDTDEAIFLAQKEGGYRCLYKQHDNYFEAEGSYKYCVFKLVEKSNVIDWLEGAYLNYNFSLEALYRHLSDIGLDK